MWKVIQISVAACMVACMAALAVYTKKHFDAARHEFYQIWESMEDQKSNNSKKEKDMWGVL